MVHPVVKRRPGSQEPDNILRLGEPYGGGCGVYIHELVLEQILDYSNQEVRREIGGFLLGGVYEDTGQVEATMAAAAAVDEASSGTRSLEAGSDESEIDQTFVEIEHFVPAHETQAGVASLTFTHETWSVLHRQLEDRYPECQIVGWHHTHPNFGIFLSGYDRFIHRHFFPLPWQVAMVVDPLNHEFGFFQWQQGTIVDTGFWCVRHRAASTS